VHAFDSHSACLLPLLEGALTHAGWSRGDVDLYVAVRGPGSFTGLRIGLGTVRGLALAAGRPCVGVGTLCALAAAFGPAEADRVPVLDAGRGEVYAARFDPSSDPPETRVEPWVAPPADLPGRIERPAVVFGPGAAAVPPAAGLRVGGAPSGIAAAAGRLGAGLVRDGAPDGTGMSPLYVRPPDAVVSPRLR
jgi:tRNA threonylcarbamoyladenosine biosynthesis protein TsaB